MRGTGMADRVLANLRRRFAAGRPADAAALDAARAAIVAGDTAGARVRLQALVAAAPRDADAWGLLGWACNDLGDETAAQQALDRAIALDPAHVEALNTLGVMAGESAYPALAIGYFERALAADPDNPATAYNLAQRLFFGSHYRRAFAMLQARHPALSGKPNPLAPLPAWQGEDLAGKHVFVWCDWGGLGDHLQFARYVPMLRARCRPARLTMGCNPECLRLFAGIEGVDAVVAPGEVPAVDLHAPLLDLPWRFDTHEGNIPALPAYLAPDAALVALWRQRLVDADAGFETARVKAGLVWATGAWNLGAGYDRVRIAKSVPAALLAPLWSSGATLVSLQKGAADAPAFPLLDLTAHITDLADTAALIANLDIVVSVDTAVAHLAGAMGKPAILLLRREGGMFWSLGAADTPWYPRMRILRQVDSGDWAPVLAQAAGLLQATA